ncbi:retrovirus-related Pol polyprotein from transposon 297 [Trichonephila clavipes]|nr:retrovirus-related Pol polyprotein from transposon 297 [Trichonephila clavipes]
MVRKELNLGLRRPFIWTFIIADVSSPIIDAEFIKHFNLLIDLKKKRLVDVETSLFTSCVFSNIVQPSILTVDANISFKNLLSEYPDLSNPSLISKSASLGTVHHIITTGPPVTARPKRLHPKLYDAVKVEFEFLLAQGIIRPSNSPWSSPLHVVPKSDSTKNSLVNVALYHIHHIWHYRVRLRESGQPIGRLRKTCKNAFPRSILVSFGRLDTPITTES